MTFRLPSATRDALSRAAEAERRSMSSMAVLALEGWLTANGYLPKPKPKAQSKRKRG